MGRITPLRILSSWRRYVKAVHEAVKAVVPDAEVYVIGGAAEGRLTVMSDIDVLVVLHERPPFERAVELRSKIIERAEELGLPIYAPLELHIAGREDLRKYAERGRVIPASEL